MDSHQLRECSCLEICLILGHSVLSVSDQSQAEYANPEMSKRVKITDHFLFRDNTDIPEKSKNKTSATKEKDWDLSIG